MTFKRSPFFYVGDKFKLLDQLIPLFPKGIDTYYEPFLGGGSVALNVKANEYRLGDKNEELIGMHRILASYSDSESLLKDIQNRLDAFGISSSFFGADIDPALKLEYPKTYFAVRNRDSYMSLRSAYNSSTKRDPLLLYILIIFGFNRLLRFNKSGDFNVPVGNVDFNLKTASAIRDYVDWTSPSSIEFSSSDYSSVFAVKAGVDDFAYLDPPYLLAEAEYNKGWSEKDEEALYEFLDHLSSTGMKWALSNSMTYRGKENSILQSWSGRYNVHQIEASYLNYHNNIDKVSGEVLVTNYA
jgi:DNA adenine methylase